MEKFIAFEKLSKKEQKRLNNSKRGDWGAINPVSRIVPSKKCYNRKKLAKPVVGY